MQSDEASPERPQKSGLLTMILWGCISLLAVYVLLFAVVCVDSFVLEHQLIQGPLARYSPSLSEQVGRIFRFIYWPEIEIMKVLKIIPA